MTQEQYERDLVAMQAEAKNFSGTPEEAPEFLSKLSEKYSELCQFNQEAMECENLEEFKNLTDSFGMQFSSEEAAEKLFVRLQTSKDGIFQVIKSQANGTELDDDALDAVTGGGVGAAVLGAVAGLVGGAIAGGVGAAKEGGSAKDIALAVLAGAGVGAAGGALFGMMVPGP